MLENGTCARVLMVLRKMVVMPFIKNPTHSVIGDNMPNKPVKIKTAPSITSINKTGIANKFANTMDGVMILKYFAVIGNIPIHTARETDTA